MINLTAITELYPNNESQQLLVYLTIDCRLSFDNDYVLTNLIFSFNLIDKFLSGYRLGRNIDSLSISSTFSTEYCNAKIYQHLQKYAL